MPLQAISEMKPIRLLHVTFTFTFRVLPKFGLDLAHSPNPRPHTHVVRSSLFAKTFHLLFLPESPFVIGGVVKTRLMQYTRVDRR